MRVNVDIGKKALIVIVVILSCWRINAQVFTGTVYDRATNQPLPDVYVSFNGTVAFAVTDNSGKFELTVAQRLNTQLVFSHIAYNMVIVENPFDELPEKIYMEQRINVLSDVIVRPDQFSRRQKLRVFREQFLGITQAGRSCRIVNEDDITIWFHLPTRTLRASSEQPIEVINQYLGYRVLFLLIDFQVEYSSVTLDRNNVMQSHFAVTTSYVDLSPDDRRIKRRRDDVYVRSSNFFFKNFANNTLNENGFQIYKDGYLTDHNLYFATEDTLSLKMIRRMTVPSLSTFSVLYRRRQSDFRFTTDTLLVDQYGNIDPFDKVIFWGTMGQNRAGDMLPIDYEP